MFLMAILAKDCGLLLAMSGNLVASPYIVIFNQIFYTLKSEFI